MNRTFPKLEDGFPLPPPTSRKERKALPRKPSPWAALVAEAKHGQSVRMPWCQLNTLKVYTKAAGVDVRFARDGDITIDEGRPWEHVTTAVRVWFVKE